MPCTPDTSCPSITTTDSRVPNFNPDGTAHFANMGWVGFVNFSSAKLNVDTILRVTAADVNLSQEITKPAVIDGRIDPTVYQLGPKIVEGTLSLPVVADIDPTAFSASNCPTAQDLTSGTAGVLLNNLWCWATSRGPQGRLKFDDVSLNIRYANHAGFQFDSAVVNTYGMSITQGDAVNLEINVIGRGRIASSNTLTSPAIKDFLSPARVMTWNDATVTGIGGCSNDANLFFSNQVREFNFEINNNAERFYSLNGNLLPMDVNVGKREITGTLTLMGFQDRLRILAETNQDRFTEKNEIRLALYIGEETSFTAAGGFASRDWTGTNPVGTPIFQKRFSSVVFQIEEVSMTNDLLETSINWHAMASDQEDYQGVSPSSSCGFPAWA